MIRSLSGRLLLTASAVLFIFLGLTGLVLDQAFQRSAEENVAEKLLPQIYGLLAAAEEFDAGIDLPAELPEPRLNRLGSGLFAFVHDGARAELWHSPSSVDLQVSANQWRRALEGLATGQQRFGTLRDQDGTRYFSLSYGILWEGDGGKGTTFFFTVLETMAPYLAEIGSFRRNLWGWLGAAAVALLIVQALVMRWGLAPLRQVAEDLKAIEDGRAEHLSGDYPNEIAGVTRNLNLLIASERQQREQYRTTLADLAHSLKTPLAVLKGAAASLDALPAEERRGTAGEGNPRLAEIAGTVEEQVDRMDEIVSYQLQRAVARTTQLLRRPVAVEPVVHKLIGAMEKVYLERQVVFETRLGDAHFLGDERDLMEVLGNLIDNACKYGRGRVRVSAESSAADRDTARVSLHLVVEDDGGGIPLGIREEVLRRGTRADDREPGQGIGLAVVAEIVHRYQGQLRFGDSSLGGARVELRFG